MIDSALDLQQTLFKALFDDTDLTASLGGMKIFDRVPEKVDCPYIVVGRSTVSDWSTSTEEGEAVVLFIHTWSKSSNRAQSHQLQAHVKRLLDDQPLQLVDHHLVALRFQFAETRRDRTTGHFHGVLRFRAVTEPK